MTEELNCELIQQAVAGNLIAINQIVQLYEPYINTLSTEKLYDNEGNEYIGVNVTLKNDLRTKLIQMIQAYKIL